MISGAWNITRRHFEAVILYFDEKWVVVRILSEISMCSIIWAERTSQHLIFVLLKSLRLWDGLWNVETQLTRLRFEEEKISPRFLRIFGGRKAHRLDEWDLSSVHDPGIRGKGSYISEWYQTLALETKIDLVVKWDVTKNWDVFCKSLISNKNHHLPLLVFMIDASCSGVGSWNNVSHSAITKKRSIARIQFSSLLA